MGRDEADMGHAAFIHPFTQGSLRQGVGADGFRAK